MLFGELGVIYASSSIFYTIYFGSLSIYLLILSLLLTLFNWHLLATTFIDN